MCFRPVLRPHGVSEFLDGRIGIRTGLVDPVEHVRGRRALDEIGDR
jgi:hypothetical protein